jgi:hypothetical protein
LIGGLLEVGGSEIGEILDSGGLRVVFPYRKTVSDSNK